MTDDADKLTTKPVAQERVDLVMNALRTFQHPELVAEFDAWRASIDVRAARHCASDYELDMAYFTRLVVPMLLECVNERSHENEDRERSVRVFETLAYVMGYEFGRIALNLVRDDVDRDTWLDGAVGFMNAVNMKWGQGVHLAMEEGAAKVPESTVRQ